jgi:DNA invertase Pin-like site-specific DNA recombinase
VAQNAANTMNRRSQRQTGRMIGYARVLTEEQATDAQSIELKAAGCDEIITEHGSGTSRVRPALGKLLDGIQAGDVLLVVRLDRLARSVSHLLDVIEELTIKGAHFRSVRDPIDTSTPQGMFSLQVLGAVAQLERALISERTKAGIKAAKAKGRLPGNPGLRERRPEALAKTAAARERAYAAKIQSTLDAWWPTVKRLRPDNAWEDVTRVLNQRPATQPDGPWTVDRLRRAVRWLVSQKLVDSDVLRRSTQKTADDRLMTLIVGIHASNPDLTLAEIGAQLERLYERTPRGGTKWSPSSVKNLLDRAKGLGL